MYSDRAPSSDDRGDFARYLLEHHHISEWPALEGPWPKAVDAASAHLRKVRRAKGPGSPEFRRHGDPAIGDLPVGVPAVHQISYLVEGENTPWVVYAQTIGGESFDPRWDYEFATVLAERQSDGSEMDAIIAAGGVVEDTLFWQNHSMTNPEELGRIVSRNTGDASASVDAWFMISYIPSSPHIRVALYGSDSNSLATIRAGNHFARSIGHDPADVTMYLRISSGASWTTRPLFCFEGALDDYRATIISLQSGGPQGPAPPAV